MDSITSGRIVQFLSKSPTIIVALVLLSPLIFFVTSAEGYIWPDVDELLWVLRNSISMALLTTVVSVLFGFLFSLGLLSREVSASSMKSGFLDLLALYPQVLPSLALLLIAFSFFNPFPMGILGVAIVLSVINIGWVALVMKERLFNETHSLSWASKVMGLKKWKFVFISFPIVQRSLFELSTFVFIQALTSFTIPLVLGGGHGTNFEVLIFEKLKMGHQIEQTKVLALAQMLLSVVFLFFAPQVKTSVIGQNGSRSFAYQFPILKWSFVGFFSLILFQGLWISIPGLIKLFSDPIIKEIILTQFLLSLSLAVGLSLVILAFLVGIAKSAAKDSSYKWLRWIPIPSTAVVLVGVLGLSDQLQWNEILTYLLVLIPLHLGLSIKMGWLDLVRNLSSYFQISRIYNLNSWNHFLETFWPLIKGQARLLFLLNVTWVLSEFAVAGLILNHSSTWGKLAGQLMSGYRVEMGLGLMLLILLVTGLLGLLMKGLKW